MQIFVFVEGVVATVMCLCLCAYFIRSRRAIGRAVGFGKGCEAVFAVGTLFFSALAQGVIDIRLDDRVVALIRVSMFTASIACSAHLLYAVHATIQEMDRAEREKDAH